VTRHGPGNVHFFVKNILESRGEYSSDVTAWGEHFSPYLPGGLVVTGVAMTLRSMAWMLLNLINSGLNSIKTKVSSC
jgi:hypothetical protein